MKPKEAMFYKKLKDKKVKCILCPKHCIISEKSRGNCLVRFNKNGKLYSLVYEKPCAVNVDPITKKPIHLFLQGTWTYSIGTAGCNLHCKSCQNWEISQRKPEDVPSKVMKIKEVVNEALKNKCPSISYTYNDFIAFYEYTYDIAKLANKKGLKNILVTNAYINPKPLKKICKFIDAVNVDLKGFNKEFYRKDCFAELKPILKSLRIFKRKKVHIEITNLIIPGRNDNFDEIKKMCKWIKKYLGKKTPIHFSRFFPMYKFKDLKQTPIETLKKAEEIAKKYLENVYLGNV